LTSGPEGRDPTDRSAHLRRAYDQLRPLCTLQSMEGTPHNESQSRGSSLLMKALAVAVLLVVAWIAIKVIIGIVSSIFWIVLAVVVVFAVIWAVVTLRS
jgi:uncharacterized protein (DUF983 family)